MADRVPVVGTPISPTSYEETLARMSQPPSHRALVVAVCNVHSVMTARADKQVAAALTAADITTPDGMPLVWALRVAGIGAQQRVYGPELMRRALVDQEGRRWRHFFYGATEEVLSDLVAAGRVLNPQIAISGTLAPPYRPLSAAEREEHLDAIRQAQPDVVWVGLGMPKQELWMSDVASELPGMSLVGVGAAFDMVSGRLPQAPPLFQRLGLEWLFRLVQEPRRLWRRYMTTNPAFLVAWLPEAIRHIRRRRSR